MDQNEIESWQKLIRVLTHEIKNSVIPISTLTEVISHMVTQEDGSNLSLSSLSEEDEKDIRKSLQTIEKRSKGLVKFVSSYGDLAKIPQPQLEEFDIKNLIRQIISLEKTEANKKDIKISFSSGKKEVIIKADPQLLEQVLINLIKNAIEALNGQKDGEVTVFMEQSEQLTSIKIKDNGPGMDQEILNNIFIPFFTTKKGGSGIGLSLSRQIIRAHKGNLKVSSKLGEGSVFEITL